jgi:hypothetical protein
MRTPTSASEAFLPKVVVRIRYADDIPASTPHAYIAMCGGDQNVSRPIDLCHEMSQ